MKVLELFCGTAHISREFARRGHDVFTVDWQSVIRTRDGSEEYYPTLSMDIGQMTEDMVLELCGGKPDMIWAAPDCTTFSIMAMRHHRQKNYITGEMEPFSDYAKYCDKTDRHVMELIRCLAPKVYVVENPCGGLRTMNYMKPMGKPQLTTYCQYDYPYRKPTDFFSNIDLHLSKPCNPRSDCHAHGRNGLTAEKDRVKRSMYPQALVEHVVDVVEEYINNN